MKNHHYGLMGLLILSLAGSIWFSIRTQKKLADTEFDNDKYKMICTCPDMMGMWK